MVCVILYVSTLVINSHLSIVYARIMCAVCAYMPYIYSYAGILASIRCISIINNTYIRYVLALSRWWYYATWREVTSSYLFLFSNVCGRILSHLLRLLNKLTLYSSMYCQGFLEDYFHINCLPHPRSKERGKFCYASEINQPTKFNYLGIGKASYIYGYDCDNDNERADKCETRGVEGA